MSLSSKVITSFILGALSAFLAWIIIDFNGFYRLESTMSIDSFLKVYSEQAFVGAMFGLMVGLGMGLVSGISGGSARRMKRDLLWGAAVGLGGGLAGLFIGQWFFGSTYHTLKKMSLIPGLGPFVFLLMVLVRGIGWGMIGLFIGLVQGLPIKSKKAMRHGAIGGLIGGLLGGMLFEVVPYILPPGLSAGVVSRGISMTITGASIGLFIGLVETLMKQAWIRVVQGRNEGKEYIISKVQTVIGRDELSDIPLFGDRDVAHQHAVIQSDAPGKYLLRDAGAPAGTAVNGQRIQEQWLKDGDTIQVGSMYLEFHEKAGAKFAKPVDVAPKPAVQIPVANDICAFCGGKKDPNTGACACTIGSQAPNGNIGGWSGSMQSQYPANTYGTFSGNGAGPRLTGVNGVYAGQAFTLIASGVTNIGREAGRDVELSLDNTVSRKHAHISFENGSYVVYDDGSANGTVVDGIRITRQPLSSGSIVQFGNSSFRFEQ